MRALVLCIPFVAAACGNDARSDAPSGGSAAKPGTPAATSSSKPSLERYTHDDPAFTIDLDRRFGSPTDAGTSMAVHERRGVDFEPAEPGGGRLEIHWDPFRWGRDPAQELTKTLDLFRNDPAPKGPIVAEGTLPGGGAWIDIEHRLGYKEHTVLAFLVIGDRVLTCNATGRIEAASVCKSLRPKS
jgi:hypothetical protein